MKMVVVRRSRIVKAHLQMNVIVVDGKRNDVVIAEVMVEGIDVVIVVVEVEVEVVVGVVVAVVVLPVVAVAVLVAVVVVEPLEIDKVSVEH